MRDTAGEVGTNSLVTYSCGPLHMDEQWLDDQLEPTYNSSVPIQDVALKTYWKQWTIEKGGGRGSGISVLMAWHDNDDDGDLTHSCNPNRFRVDLAVMEVKGYGTLSKAPELKTHHQILFIVIPRKLPFGGRGLTTLLWIEPTYSKPNQQDRDRCGAT